MSLITVEVEIEGGRLTAKEPHRLPARGVGWLTVAAEEIPAIEPRKRVRLPLVRSQSGGVINPSAEELDASLWD